MTAEPTRCNYCEGEIMWLTTATGKRMPVDAHPCDNGNVIRQGGHAGVLGPAKAAAARAAGVPLRLHHAVSCPFAPQWQGKAARR